MQQHVIVLRHGERLDDADPDWRDSLPTQPFWDPPLSDKGLQQAWEAGRQLRSQGLTITHVYSSPFLRCLQTATAASQALGLTGEAHISWGLSELLLRLRDPPSGPLCTWMWPQGPLSIKPAGGGGTASAVGVDRNTWLNAAGGQDGLHHPLLSQPAPGVLPNHAVQVHPSGDAGSHALNPCMHTATPVLPARPVCTMASVADTAMVACIPAELDKQLAAAPGAAAGALAAANARESASGGDGGAPAVAAAAGSCAGGDGCATATAVVVASTMASAPADTAQVGAATTATGPGVAGPAAGVQDAVQESKASALVSRLGKGIVEVAAAAVDRAQASKPGAASSMAARIGKGLAGAAAAAAAELKAMAAEGEVVTEQELAAASSLRNGASTQLLSQQNSASSQEARGTVGDMAAAAATAAAAAAKVVAIQSPERAASAAVAGNEGDDGQITGGAQLWTDTGVMTGTSAGSVPAASSDSALSASNGCRAYPLSIGDFLHGYSDSSASTPTTPLSQRPELASRPSTLVSQQAQAQLAHGTATPTTPASPATPTTPATPASALGLRPTLGALALGAAARQSLDSPRSPPGQPHTRFSTTDAGACTRDQAPITGFGAAQAQAAQAEQVPHVCPAAPESLEDAYRRFDEAVQQLVEAAAPGNVLLVTHGDLVGRAVALFGKGAIAYEVSYAGYVIATRTATAHASTNPTNTMHPCPPRDATVTEDLACGALPGLPVVPSLQASTSVAADGWSADRGSVGLSAGASSGAVAGGAGSSSRDARAARGTSCPEWLQGWVAVEGARPWAHSGEVQQGLQGQVRATSPMDDYPGSTTRLIWSDWRLQSPEECEGQGVLWFSATD